MCTRLKFVERTFRKIDWVLHRKALSKVSPNYSPSIQTLLCKESHTTSKLARDGNLNSGLCPLCGDVYSAENFVACRVIRNDARVNIRGGNLEAKI